MLYAQHFGYQYVHSPLQDVAHFGPDDDHSKWASDWEDFFSLGTNELPASDFANLEPRFLRRPHRWRPRANKLNFVRHCHKITDKHSELWHRFRPELRKRFAITPKPPPFGQGQRSHQIAVHIRRGDVRPDNQFTSRFTPNQRILEVLSKIIFIEDYRRSRGSTPPSPHLLPSGIRFLGL